MCMRAIPVSFDPGIDLPHCMLRESRFDVGLSAMSRPASRRADTLSLARNDERVPADPAQEILAGRPSQPVAVLAEIGHEADLVIGPANLRQDFSERAVSLAMRSMKAALSRTDMIFWPLRTMRVSRGQIVPEIIRLEEQSLRLEA